MNKLSKDKRDKLLLVVIGTIIVTGALYFLVVTAQQQHLADYLATVDATQEKLAKAERWVRMAPGIQANLDGNRKDLEVKHEFMAPIDKFKWFYNTLEKFLSQYAVKLLDITREPEVGEAGVLPKFPYQAATFGVKLRARFHDFGRCLADFENQFPYMRVENIELEPETSGKPGAQNSAAAVDAAEQLAITLRVVTLIKPATPL